MSMRGILFSSCWFVFFLCYELKINSQWFLPILHLSFIRYKEERRVRKWRKMIGVGGSDWKHYLRRKPHVVKRRIRKGIPDCLRGLVWQLISGSRDLLLMNPGVYEVIKLNYTDEKLWYILYNIVLPMISACLAVVCYSSPINMNWRIFSFLFAHLLFMTLYICACCCSVTTLLGMCGVWVEQYISW